eukprot:CAMPEP_0196826004 /NCGR_PEP_ID=MMETSP1362-20130617/93387_1 /TAXON_ID=163516 /ORGANISM="Leptocylindrus danicus, Strain CCMP1856" /LENGTH=70 /DNA_ID=CAMNT_0042206533 /DNA_START=918 /DNA_END=1131 /DNA_ORIENTATION=+
MSGEVHACADTDAAAAAPADDSTLIPPLKRRFWSAPMTLLAAAVRAEVVLGADAKPSMKKVRHRIPLAPL